MRHCKKLRPNVGMMAFVVIASVYIGLMGCSKEEKSSWAVEGDPSTETATVVSLAPVSAKPGDEIQLVGTNFYPNRGLRARFTKSDGTTVDIDLNIKSENSATFVMPEGLGLGWKSVELLQGSKKTINSFSMVANSSSNSKSIFTGSQSDVCSDFQYIDSNGESKIGTRDCSSSSSASNSSASNSALANCSSSGDSDCTLPTYATAPGLKAVKVDSTSASSLPVTLSACSSDGAASCLLTGAAPYSMIKAVDSSLFDSSKIIAGTTIAGITGTAIIPANCAASGGSGCTLPTYSSAPGLKSVRVDSTTESSLPTTLTACASNGATGCLLTGSSPYTTIKAVDNSLFDSSKIVSGTTIAGVSGSVVLPSAWELRFDSTVGSVTGLAKHDCRNSSNTSIQNEALPVLMNQPASGSSNFTGTNSFSVGNRVRLISVNGATLATNFASGSLYYVTNSSDSNNVYLSATSGGAAISAGSVPTGQVALSWIGDTTLDVWDTVDDWNNNTSMPTTIPTTLASWTSNKVCYGTTTSLSASQIWLDVTTTGDGTTSSTCATSSANCSYRDKVTDLEFSKSSGTTLTWPEAVLHCNSLTHNGKSGWRLPTQKELQQAYIHGIRSAAGANFSTTLSTVHWSSTTDASDYSKAWYVVPATGKTVNDPKKSGYTALCVRSN